MSECDNVCPECEAGKHGNCDGTAWCFRCDEMAGCRCKANRHAQEDA